MSPNEMLNLFEQTRPGIRPSGDVKAALDRSAKDAAKFTPWRYSLASRLVSADGKPGSNFRLPHPARRFPPFRREYWELIQSQVPGTYNGSSPQETAVLGAAVSNSPFHVSSAMVRPASGEFSLAAVVSSGDLGDPLAGYDPTTTFGLFLQANYAAASLTVSFYHPELLSSSCDELMASITLTADHIQGTLGTYSQDESDDFSGSAIYGNIAVTLRTGLYEPPASASQSSEFIRIENVQGVLDTNYVALQAADGTINPVTLWVTLPYDKKSTLFFVTASIEIDCCMIAEGKKQYAICDLRFGDDDNLKVIEDGVSAADNPVSCPLQISNFSLYGRFLTPRE
jgi:hypothetical protein